MTSENAGDDGKNQQQQLWQRSANRTNKIMLRMVPSGSGGGDGKYKKKEQRNNTEKESRNGENAVAVAAPSLSTTETKTLHMCDVFGLGIVYARCMAIAMHQYAEFIRDDIKYDDKVFSLYFALFTFYSLFLDWFVFVRLLERRITIVPHAIHPPAVAKNYLRVHD